MGEMALFIGYGVGFFGIYIIFLLSRGQPRKKKYIASDLTLMFVISPFLSFGNGLTYAIIEGSGWAGMLMFILFPIGFLIGLIILMTGLFMKKGTTEH